MDKIAALGCVLVPRMHLFRLPLVAILVLSTSLGRAAPPPPQTGNAKSLFDGRTLDGWESPTPQLWSVKDGCLTGGDGNKIPYNDFLCTKASFSNFVLHLKIKLTGDPKTGMINSGIQIRTKRNPTGHEVCGYQCDYGEPNWYAGIYDEGRRNKFIAPADMNVIHPAVKLWDWNDYVIKADGNRIQTWINGVQGVDYKEEDPNIPSDGILGIQVHGGGNTNVQVKDVFIDELPPTQGAPTWESLGGVEGVRAKLKPNPQAAIANPKSKRDISYNASDAQPKTPEEEQKTFTLPKGFEIELVASESAGVGKFVTVDWDQKGRMWTQTALEYPVDGNENMERAQALYASPGKDKVLVFDDTAGPAPHKFRVFTDGLAIPLGMLPYRNGVYVQHGPNIEFREDTDGDGKADKTTTILTGFGVQDSHLFMHEFRRMPGGWIWGAQGAFNSGKVKTTTGVETDFPGTRMARFRPDGSQFEILCTGPCNIWGFEVTGEGEMFIQEANDFGYPVMPFHIGANYPGCADRLWKSYAPEFPGPAQFRMGGTGLSGLALANKNSAFASSPHSPSAASPEPHSESADHRIMYVANPIIRKIQAIKIKPDGPRHTLELLPDFIESSDPMFRPISIHFGPDGALYIVDWYNKIISHNEVPRNHPDRDKTRGRIWRIKPRSDGILPSETSVTAGSRHSLPMPDLTKCAPEQLVSLLGSDNIKQSHLAWQAIIDRKLTELAPKLKAIISDGKAKTAERIEALWALEEIGPDKVLETVLKSLLSDTNRNIRREAVRLVPIFYRIEGQDPLNLIAALAEDPDPEVRAEVIRSGFYIFQHDPASAEIGQRGRDAVSLLIRMAKPPLDAPVGPSTRNGKPIKIAEAYEREFERYLVRSALETCPNVIENRFTSPDAEDLPLENRMLATLSLPAKTSAPLVAKLLGQLQRPPNDEEILRLAEGLGDPAVNEALAAALKNPKSRQNIAAALLRLRTKLDANTLAPLLQTTARELLDGNEASQDLALQLAGEFQFAELETPMVALLKNWLADHKNSPRIVASLRALGLMGSNQTELFARLVTTEKDPQIRNEALGALASSKAADAGVRVLALWKDLDSPSRRLALNRLTTTKPGAHAVVAALKSKTLKADDLDAAALDRLQAVLGPKDPELAGVMNELSALFRPVLRLDGGKDSYAETGLTLDGPFTVETWVRLDPGIGNEDGILGSPGQLDMNFFAGQFRVWVGGTTHDAIVAKKKMAPDNWTHIAVTRDAKGRFRIYIDGELDQDVSKLAPQKFENVRVGWAQPVKGMQGMLSEFRIWNRVRSPEEIRNHFDRGVDRDAKGDGLAYHGTGEQWGRLHGKARITKTSDLPPLLSPEEAKKLDEKFAKYRTLALKPGGDPAKGKLLAALCMGCHLIQGQGGNLAPNISGAGTMGVEGLLRNILTPNAAMEAGYRTFRVELNSGDIVDAFFVNEDKDAVIVRLPGVPDRRIPRAEVRSTKYIRRSLMPEGILDALQPEMVTDLFTYLMSLKG